MSTLDWSFGSPGALLAIPAIDLREGACVQLVGGDYANEAVRRPDPVAVAREWEEAGFPALHIVDLDAATGRGTNRRVIERILATTALEVQVGGGVRDEDAIAALLEAGASRVVVGTRAFEDRDWLVEMADTFPRTLVVAADVRQRKVTVRGWETTLPLDIEDAVRELNELPLAGLLVTAVHQEGSLQGADHALMGDVVAESQHPVIASGGIATALDLRRLADAGVRAAVLGMALYTGALDARDTAEEFSR
ncbi:MAG: 1-(5-phosphoribosyl)-5-[(5-phosphoribosylamino)methylideneamino]imidazole-4-carboxamide isomerase [Gemmatimonadaceae bacterium]|nr:1-(5-phosphoribosyl)-5-[(5-phosphoribosylamino)methylideneamino]imidazole-4-carboxamide isomerase [Gemmatimonadaceae bacterium]